MLFKIVFNEETHLMKYKQGHNFFNLLTYVANTFKKLPPTYVFVYVDEEGDQVNLENQLDFDGLVDSGLNKVTIKILETQHNQDNHFGKINAEIKLEKPTETNALPDKLIESKGEQANVIDSTNNKGK